MYADQVATGPKRSVKERLNGDMRAFSGSSMTTAGVKRQRQDDDKWKHDLYQDNEPQTSKSRVGDKDLRLKLQRKSTPQSFQSGKSSGVRDLREKLSGTMHSQSTNTDHPKDRTTPDVTRTAKKSAVSVKAAVVDNKKATTSSPSKKRTKTESSVDGLLHSLGLEKYLITFQAEEVDMTALMHMTDADLKALGIPMGPRKKILLALDSRS